jgi:hypothetical protein
MSPLSGGATTVRQLSAATARVPTSGAHPVLGWELCDTGATSIQRPIVEEINTMSHIYEPFRLQHLQDGGALEVLQERRASQDIRRAVNRTDEFIPQQREYRP